LFSSFIKKDFLLLKQQKLS